MPEHEENRSDSDTGWISWLLLGVLVFLLAGGGFGAVVVLRTREMRAIEADEAQERARAAQEALEGQKAAEEKEQP